MTSKGQTAILGLLNKSGYRLVRADCRMLGEHLGRLAGKGRPWGADYLMAVAKDQLDAGKSLLEAIGRCDRYPPPPLESVYARQYLMPSLICVCGRVFIPNVPWRRKCYDCHPRDADGSAPPNAEPPPGEGDEQRRV
jgi:hypothetical protein